MSPIPRKPRLAALLVPAAALLGGCNTILLNPYGDIAVQQGRLIVISTVLMLLIIVPVIALTLLFAWRYRQSNTQATYLPEWDHSLRLELVIWAAPLMIIIVLGALTWITTHTLDPYRPLQQIDSRRPLPPETRPLTIEVVALDWKWLFIYPEQGVAVVNDLAIPVDVPVRFRITAENVMNSFYVPALAGQIYAMPGMETQLNAVINHAGQWQGFSANYSGAGFSGMHFAFHGMSSQDFDRWIDANRGATAALDRPAYLHLAQPSIGDGVQRYGSIDPGLYDAIVNRCVAPDRRCMRDLMAGHGHAADRAAGAPAGTEDMHDMQDMQDMHDAAPGAGAGHHE